MRGNENGKTRSNLDIRQVHSSDFLTSPIVDCQLQVLWQRPWLLLLLSGQTFIWSVRYCLSDDEDGYGICTSSDCGTRVRMDTSCRKWLSRIFGWKGEYIGEEMKNARKRESKNKEQPKNVILLDLSHTYIPRNNYMNLSHSYILCTPHWTLEYVINIG